MHRGCVMERGPGAHQVRHRTSSAHNGCVMELVQCTMGASWSEPGVRWVRLACLVLPFLVSIDGVGVSECPGVRTTRTSDPTTTGHIECVVRYVPE